MGKREGLQNIVFTSVSIQAFHHTTYLQQHKLLLWKKYYRKFCMQTVFFPSRYNPICKGAPPLVSTIFYYNQKQYKFGLIINEKGTVALKKTSYQKDNKISHILYVLFLYSLSNHAY